MQLGTLVAVAWWMILPLVAVGSLLHFVYDWSGHHRAAAVFGAVNESYWEHVKIAVWPAVLQFTVLFVVGGYAHPAFVPAATVALYAIPAALVGGVFLYKAVTRRNVLWVDIVAFALAVAVGQAVFATLLPQLAADARTIALAALFLVGLLVAFTRFTLRPPREPDLFRDPLTSRYGIPGHGHPVPGEPGTGGPDTAEPAPGA